MRSSRLHLILKCIMLRSAGVWSQEYDSFAYIFRHITIVIAKPCLLGDT